MPAQPNDLTMRLFQDPDEKHDGMVDRNKLLGITHEIGTGGKWKVIEGKKESWPRIEKLTVGDLWGLLAFSHEDDPKQGSEHRQTHKRVKELVLDDIYTIGAIMAKWRGIDGAEMKYPDGVYSCCCCADFEN